MRLLIQRVSRASVTIDQKEFSRIGKGLLVLVGIEEADTREDIDWLVGKLCRLRIFDDEQGVMNLDIQQIGGEVMVVSQFTLHASTKKGNRPSFIDAAKPDHGDKMYQLLNETLRNEYGLKVSEGEFGADMQVSLVNDGPVTIILDSDEA